MGKLISKRYAVALFELAKEMDKLDEFYSQIEPIYFAIKDDKDFFEVLNHPQISGNEKFDIFKNIFQDNVPEEILSFLHIIIDKNRENEISSILETFLNLVNEHKGITTAFVYSATELTNNQLLDIKEKLSKNLNKEVIIEAKIKPDLIGGMLINVDGKVIDNSIKKGIDDIKKALLTFK